MRIAKFIAAAAVVASGLTASLGLAAPRALAVEDAKVRVGHFSPNAPAVDVYVDGRKTFAQVPFPLMSAYTPLPPGKHTVDIRAAGSPATDKPIISQSTDLEAGKAYLVAAIGPATAIQGKIINDDLTPPAAGKARLRIINAAVNGPAVDAVAGGAAKLFENVPFGSAAAYSELDASKYDLSIRETGKANQLVGKVISLASGGVYTIVAIGDASSQIGLRGFADLAPSGTGSSATQASAVDPTGADTGSSPTTTTAGGASASSTPTTTATTATAAATATTSPSTKVAPTTTPAKTTPATTKPAATPTTQAGSDATEVTVPIGGTNETIATDATVDNPDAATSGNGADDTTVDVPAGETAAAGTRVSNGSTPTSGVATGFGGMSDANSAAVLVGLAVMAGVFVLLGLRRRSTN